MAKTLKEALLEQMATLQERGLALGELPVEHEEALSYSDFEEESVGRSFVGDRDRDSRRRAGGRAVRQRVRTPTPRRETREPREARRERRDSREPREPRDLPVDLVGPPPAMPPRVLGPRPAGPPPAPRPGPRPPARADLLRRNAERIQREQQERSEIQALLATYAGEEIDDAALEKYFSKLAVETGALPPLNVVLAAMQNAGGSDPVEVGNQVRLYYRRARNRVPPAPVAVG